MNKFKPSPFTSFPFSAADMRSKTDNLDRLINEVDRSSTRSTDNVNANGREVKRYIRYFRCEHPQSHTFLTE